MSKREIQRCRFLFSRFGVWLRGEAGVGTGQCFPCPTPRLGTAVLLGGDGGSKQTGNWRREALEVNATGLNSLRP